ncbi:hypothetical protein QRX50_21810 [Amycolatopsis carbonis]|uniref:Uncharacterized protein n=1 Tax=Amycolatopsis carbonis TaxID=715471 RepID=A0A9Y2IPU0_9PSEU|nr:hypothetical protein [Amycolatopsis sp. 2-15]WIX83206.1 hypothetical protein QRX50_21810 [Amycolatopsis sp. 2-15]
MSLVDVLDDASVAEVVRVSETGPEDVVVTVVEVGVVVVLGEVVDVRGVVVVDVGELVDVRVEVEVEVPVYAAGNTAAAVSPSEGRVVMQSCQHALPQGKFAGHNVAADLLGEELVRFEPVPYVTCLSLGPAGAVVTSG